MNVALTLNDLYKVSARENTGSSIRDTDSERLSCNNLFTVVVNVAVTESNLALNLLSDTVAASVTLNVRYAVMVRDNTGEKVALTDRVICDIPCLYVLMMVVKSTDADKVRFRLSALTIETVNVLLTTIWRYAVSVFVKVKVKVALTDKERLKVRCNANVTVAVETVLNVL